ncbi:BatD family protein [Aquirufa sp.]|jgi:hypothetical protein|uniref:BatD family protein n=1 Tax=Aquirufa sp. TaxID=2676249 RepID=UPI0037BEE978
MRYIFYLLGFLLAGLLPTNAILAQSKEHIVVQMGPKSILANEQFSLQFSIPLGEQMPTYQFPEINGFRKLGVSRSKASNFENEQVVQTLTFTQYYQPNAQGSFSVPSVALDVNKHVFEIEPFVIQVLPALEKKDALSDEIKIPAQVDLKTNKPFFLVRSDVSNPFVGQAFTLTMSLYVPADNVLEMSFDHNDIQIPALIQQIRPRNCWEENFGLQVERVLQVTFRGKKYTEYRFFQATYYALDAQVIRIPSVRFRVLQGNKSKEKSAMYFNSQNFTIQPRALPKHVLSGKVPVGRYSLEETLDHELANTGDRLLYKSKVIGDGNSILWDTKEVASDYFLSFNLLSTERIVFPFGNQMFGNKSDVVRIIPEQPGKFALANYFSWIFFNVDKERFDTLKSKLVIEVKGQPRDRKLDTSLEKGGVYEAIEQLDSLQVQWNRWVNWRQLVNFVLIIMFGFIVFLFWRASK